MGAPPGAGPLRGPPTGKEPGLLSFVERRAASVRAQLEGTRAGVVVEGGPGGRPPRGPQGPGGPQGAPPGHPPEGLPR